MSITGMRQSFACHASHIVFFMLPGVIAVENLGGHRSMSVLLEGFPRDGTEAQFEALSLDH